MKLQSLFKRSIIRDIPGQMFYNTQSQSSKSSVPVDATIMCSNYKAVDNFGSLYVFMFPCRTQFFIVHKGEDREQAMLTDNRVTLSKCSCDKTAQALGVRMCAELSYPASTKADAPYFPFTGPVTGSVELTKTDDHEAYEFEAYLKAEKEKGAINRFARLSFNTPNSKVDREIFADVTLDSANQKVSANVRTPWKQATIDGK